MSDLFINEDNEIEVDIQKKYTFPSNLSFCEYEGKYLINPALVLFIVVTNDNSNKVFFHDKIVTVDNVSLEVLTTNFNWIRIYDSHNDMCYLNEKKISAVFIEDRRMFFLFDGEKFERSFSSAKNANFALQSKYSNNLALKKVLQNK